MIGKEFKKIEATKETRNGIDILTLPISKFGWFFYQEGDLKLIFISSRLDANERKAKISWALRQFENKSHFVPYEQLMAKTLKRRHRNDN